MSSDRDDQPLTDADRRACALAEDVLGAALRVEPRPVVAARVRRRLAEPAARSRPGVWWALAAAAGLAAAALGHRVWTPPAPTAPLAAAQAPAAVHPVPPPRPAAPPPEAAPRPVRRPVPGRPRRPAPEPEVIVPAGQLEALPRFLQALRARGARPPVVRAADSGPAPAPSEPAGIDVPSIEFAPIDRGARVAFAAPWPLSYKE